MACTLPASVQKHFGYLIRCESNQTFLLVALMLSGVIPLACSAFHDKAGKQTLASLLSKYLRCYRFSSARHSNQHSTPAASCTLRQMQGITMFRMKTRLSMHRRFFCPDYDAVSVSRRIDFNAKGPSLKPSPRYVKYRDCFPSGKSTSAMYSCQTLVYAN